MKSLLIGLAVLVFGYLGYYFYITPNYSAGEKAYNFSWQVGADQVDLESLQGNYVLLDFWGSWCGPCRKENPELVRLYDSFQSLKTSQNHGFTIVSVGLETNESRWKSAIAKDGLKWPHHTTDLMRMKSPIAIEYGVREIPSKFLINPEGVIVMVNPSLADLEQRLKDGFK